MKICSLFSESAYPDLVKKGQDAEHQPAVLKTKVMKSCKLLLLYSLLLVFGSSSFAQGDENGSAGSLFKKGKNYFTMQKNIGYSHFNNYQNRYNYGRTGDLLFRFDYKYFIADNIAIGLDLNTRFINADNALSVGTAEKKNTDWSLYGTLTYGRTFSSGLNLYGEAAAGIGALQHVVETSGGDVKEKTNLTGVRIKIGLPLSVGENTFFTPFLLWNNAWYKLDEQKTTYSLVGLGISLESSLFCREMKQDTKEKQADEEIRYKHGDSYITVYSAGLLGFGTIKSGDGAASQKDKLSTTGVALDYIYYFTDYLGIGTGFSINSLTVKNESGGDKTPSSVLEVNPQLIFNIPVSGGISNIYLQAEGKLGRKTDFEYAYSTDVSDFSRTGFGIHVGYNLFFTGHLCLSSMAGYESRSDKSLVNDKKYKQSGFALGSGLRFFF